VCVCVFERAVVVICVRLVKHFACSVQVTNAYEFLILIVHQMRRQICSQGYTYGQTNTDKEVSSNGRILLYFRCSHNLNRPHFICPGICSYSNILMKKTDGGGGKKDNACG